MFGYKPVWNCIFDITVKPTSDEMHFSVRDNDTEDSKLIGTAIIKVSALCKDLGVNEWFSIDFEGEEAGEILIESKFTPN